LIILDTNVLSELSRNEPEVRVLRWLDEQPAESVWTTSITVYEARFGIELMAAGRKRERLEREFNNLIAVDLRNRVLPFDTHSANLAGALGAQHRRAGQSMEIRDLQIAGIAAAHKATLATRNTRHFEGVGLLLVDPWTA
jgi:predicted nucleic acid-binding protein